VAGLKKDIDFKGVNLNYHWISHVAVNYRNGKGHAVILSYINKAAFNANPENFFKSFQVDLEGMSGNINLNDIYNVAKTTTEFSGALDD